MRGKGAVLRTSLSADVTLENVRDAWSKVTDMSQAEHMSSATQATTTLMEALDKFSKGGQSDGGTITEDFAFSPKDLILYALGVGATVKDSVDLKFLYENHPDFAPLPTFFIQPAIIMTMTTSLVSSAITHKEVNLTQVLHGEQYLEVFDELPTDGKLITTGKILDVVDKRSGAVVVAHCE